MPAKPAKPSLKGKEIVDPQMAVFVKLDDLQRVIQKEFAAQRDVLVQLLNTELISQEHLKAIRQSQTRPTSNTWRKQSKPKLKNPFV